MIEFILQDILIYSLWEMTEVVAMVVFIANTVSMWLPNHSRYKPIQWILDVLNKLSLNVAKNANRLHHTLERTAGRERYDIDEAIRRATAKREKEDRIGGREP